MGIPNQIYYPNESKLPLYEEEEKRSKSKVWLVFLVVAAALGASGYYGYLTLKKLGYLTLNKQNVQIGQLFGSQAALDALGQRVDATESRMREMTGGWEALVQRVKKLEGLEGRFRDNLQQTRKYAEGLTQQLHQQLSAEMAARNSDFDARLRQVESQQAGQSSQIANVEAELKQEIASAREEAGRNLSGVYGEVEANARDLGVLSQRLEPKRVDFELTKGQTEELIPGISLRISATDPSYQRYSGSLWLLQDRRRVWLRDHSVHEPVRFFHKETDEPYELVVTDVTKKSVVGYLLTPAQPEAAGTSTEQPTAIPAAGND